MTNGTRPDLSDFFKQARHSYNSSRTGTRNVQNATDAQRRFLGVKKDMTTTTIRGNWPAPAEAPEPAPVKPAVAAKSKPAAKPQAKPAIPVARQVNDDDFRIVSVPYTFRQALPGVSIYEEQIDYLLANPDDKCIESPNITKAKRLVTALNRKITVLNLREKYRVAQRNVDGYTRVWVLSRA